MGFSNVALNFTSAAVEMMGEDLAFSFSLCNSLFEAFKDSVDLSNAELRLIFREGNASALLWWLLGCFLGHPTSNL